MAFREVRFVEQYCMAEITEIRHMLNLTAARLAYELSLGLQAERIHIVKVGPHSTKIVHTPDWSTRLGYARILAEIILPGREAR